MAARLSRFIDDLSGAVLRYQACLAEDPTDEVAAFGLAALGAIPMPRRVPDSVLMSIFDRNAGGYDTNMASVGYRVPDVLAKLVLDQVAKGPLSILDLGCGTGLNAGWLKPLASRLVGIDLAPQMLKLAENRRAYDCLIEAEIEAWLEQTPERFDLVVASNVLIYFGALDRLLRGLVRVLNSCGMIAVDLEKAPEEGADDIRLEPVGGRYAHAASYVRNSLAVCGLDLVSLNETIMRHEQGRPVTGLFVLAKRAGVEGPRSFPTQATSSAPT